MTSNGPVKVNETMRFEIDLGKLGTGTCMWVDLGDNSPLHVFGNQSCPGQINVDSINPNIVAVPRMMYTYKPPDTQYITISHVYARVASVLGSLVFCFLSWTDAKNEMPFLSAGNDTQ